MRFRIMRLISRRAVFVVVMLMNMYLRETKLISLSDSRSELSLFFDNSWPKQDIKAGSNIHILVSSSSVFDYTLELDTVFLCGFDLPTKRPNMYQNLKITKTKTSKIVQVAGTIFSLVGFLPQSILSR